MVSQACSENQVLKEIILSLETKVDSLVETVESLSTKAAKSKSAEGFLTEVLFQNQNLIDIHASSMSKYVTRLMEILFTSEERKVGYIIEEGSTSKRTALDENRVKILKGEVF